MYYVYYSAEIEILACHMPALAQAALGLPSPGLVSPRAPGPGCNLHNWQERRDASAAPCRVMGSRGQPWAAVGGRGQLSSSGRRGVRVSADSLTRHRVELALRISSFLIEPNLDGNFQVFSTRKYSESVNTLFCMT